MCLCREPLSQSGGAGIFCRMATGPLSISIEWQPRVRPDKSERSARDGWLDTGRTGRQ